MQITIPLKCPSLNNMYAGMHYRKRMAMKDEWRSVVMAELHKFKWKPFNESQYPLMVFAEPHFKQNRKRDVDNNIVAVKLFLDALVAEGIIPDDNSDYVKRIILEQPLVTGEDKVVFTVR